MNFPFIRRNIPSAPVYGDYVSHVRACGSYHDFLERGLLLSRNVLNQGLLLINMNSSLRQIYGRHRYGISDNGYVPCVVITIMSFPNSFLTFRSARIYSRFFSAIRFAQFFYICVVLSGFFVLLFFWSLYCLSFNLRLLIIPLVSSNFSYYAN